MRNHPLCRPPKGAIDVRRLGSNGRFKIDDGTPGLAFFGIAMQDVKAKSAATVDENVSVWVANCDCKIHGECPASKTLDKACAIYDSASLVRRPASRSVASRAKARSSKRPSKR